MERTNYQTQIIILEHAPKLTWEGDRNIYLAAEWRGSGPLDPNYDALIPKEWLKENR